MNEVDYNHFLTPDEIGALEVGSIVQDTRGEAWRVSIAHEGSDDRIVKQVTTGHEYKLIADQPLPLFRRQVAA